MRQPTASAITSGGSATCESFSRIIRTGSFATGCAKFSKKFTMRWQDDLSTARVAATEGLTTGSTDDTDVHKKMGPTKHAKDANKKSLSPNFRVFWCVSWAEKMLRLWRFNGSTPRKEDAA